MRDLRRASRRNLWARIAVVLAVVASMVVLTTSTAPAATTLRILPLGDSITAGINGHDSYRFPLGQSLSADGSGSTSWGTRPAGPTPAPGRRCSARRPASSTRTTRVTRGTRPTRSWPACRLGLDGRLRCRAAACRHQRLLLPVGLPSGRNREPRPAGLDHRRVAGRQPVCRGARGQAHQGHQEREHAGTRIDELAGLIDGLAAAKTTPASPVVSVDLNTGFQTTWLYDGLHADVTGESWMADQWRAALNPYLDCTGSTNAAPVVTSPGNQSSVQGAAIAPLAVVASDPDVGQVLTFSQTGLPAGLVLNASTGVITGTPTTVGTGTVTVTTTDNGSPVRSGSATFLWAVNPVGGGTSSSYRAINLNGAAITAGGITFEAGTAANVSSGPNRFVTRRSVWCRRRMRTRRRWCGARCGAAGPRVRRSRCRRCRRGTTW